MSEVQTVFPHVIDNALLKQFRRCAQSAWRGRLQGLHAKGGESIDLHFGKCFAAGIEHTRRLYFEGGATAKSAVVEGGLFGIDLYTAAKLALPARSNKTAVNLAAAFTHYWLAWPLGEDGLTPINDGIEYEFKVPLTDFGLRHPVDGAPLYYGGRCDLAARNEAGGVVVVDEKTAAKFSDTWFMSWDMDSQMTGYLWALSAFSGGQELPHGLVRGISISSTEIGHTLVPVFRTRHQIAVWLGQVVADVRRLQGAFTAGYWDYNLGDACTAFGRPCEFKALCNAPNPAPLIQENYGVEFWSPTTRTDLQPLALPAHTMENDHGY